MITGNEPAFPIDGNHLKDGINKDFSGLTIRQQFAMAAMQGLLSNPEINKGYSPYTTWAKEAVSAADALIAELNKSIEP